MADSRILQLNEGTPGAGKWAVGADASSGTNFRFELASLSGATEVTYAQASTLISNEALQTGNRYHITDKNVLLVATSTTTFAFEGFGRFDMPDYSTHAVWVSDSGGGSYIATDKVAYDGSVYENDTGTNTDTAPPSDGTNWSIVAYNETDYLREWDSVLYSFSDDLIFGRKDKRGNHVESSLSEAITTDPVAQFQWGNGDYFDNKIIESDVDILNARLTAFSLNIVTGDSLIITNEASTGSITRNRLGESATISISGTLTGTIRDCAIVNDSSIFVTGTYSGFYTSNELKKSAVTWAGTSSAQFTETTLIGSSITLTDQLTAIQTMVIIDLVYNKPLSLDIQSSNGNLYANEISSIGRITNMSVDIVDFPSTTTMELDGDERTAFEEGDTIQIVGSSSNDGSYTIDTGGVSFAAGVTTITITGTWTVEGGAGTVTGQILVDDDQGVSIAGLIGINLDPSTVTIKKIKQVSSDHNIVFYPFNGKTITFEHVAVASVSSDEITLLGGVDLSLTGRSDFKRSDQLVLRKSATYNREIYHSILV